LTSERPRLTWPGKDAALDAARTAPSAILAPCPGEGIDETTTRNRLYEADNLEVLKLLRAEYAGRVKMIYIDPPYNTGSDRLYRDADPHAAWLDRLLPRLVVARDLLRPDGIVFISIDDRELPSLRLLADEVFGEDRRLACFVWKSRQNKENRTTTGVSVDHEYVLCYGPRVRGAVRDAARYTNPDGDRRGAWTSANMVGIATAARRPNLHHRLVDPRTGVDYGCPPMGWRYDRATMARLVAEDRILWPPRPDGRPRRKVFLVELGSKYTGLSSIIGEGVYTRDGARDLDRLFGRRVFPFPKPVALVASLVEQGSTDDDIVLDFYAGSGTTGEAVWTQNLRDGGRRSFVLVQVPEPLSPAMTEQRTAAAFCDECGKPRTLAEITKERLRRASADLRGRHPAFQGDLGFRVYGNQGRDPEVRARAQPPGSREIR